MAAVARNGKEPGKDVSFPGIVDGAAGNAFIETCEESSRANGKWVRV